MIVIDTSALVDSLCGLRKSKERLRALGASGERVVLSTLVLYEWLRGPRLRQELLAQEELFPRDQAIPFGTPEASLAAELYRKVRSARRREMDLAIAATALARNAGLWTLNRQDFRDIPGLQLV